MKKKRFNEEQIVRILQEAETGIPARDICRKHSISEQTYYRWKSEYRGMDVSEAKWLKGFERKNTELKKLVAELTLVNARLILSYLCRSKIPHSCRGPSGCVDFVKGRTILDRREKFKLQAIAMRRQRQYNRRARPRFRMSEDAS